MKLKRHHKFVHEPLLDREKQLHEDGKPIGKKIKWPCIRCKQCKDTLWVLPYDGLDNCIRRFNKLWCKR